MSINEINKSEALASLVDKNILCQERWQKALFLLNDKDFEWNVASWGGHGLNVMETNNYISLSDLGLFEDRRAMHFVDIDEALDACFELLELEISNIEEWREHILETYISKGYNSYIRY